MLASSYWFEIVALLRRLGDRHAYEAGVVLRTMLEVRIKLGRWPVHLARSVIEQTKEGFYDSLYGSSQGWHEAQHSIVPWWEYFVGVMLVKAYRDFEDRVGVTRR